MALVTLRQLSCTSIAQMRALPAEVLQKANDQYGMRNGFNLYPDGWVLPEEVDLCFAKGLERDVDIIIGCTVDEGANGSPSRWHYNTLASVYALGHFRPRNDDSRRVMRLAGGGCAMSDYNSNASLRREAQDIIAQYEAATKK